MPNYVRTIITADEDVINSLDRRTLNDFIPRPRSLDIEESSYSADCFKLYLDNLNEDEQQKLIKASHFKDVDLKASCEKIKNHYTEEELEKMFNLGKEQAQNVMKYGARSWYDWSIKNWGTKWNAYFRKTSRTTAMIETAWNVPSPVLEYLSQKLKYDFTAIYADEGNLFAGMYDSRTNHYLEDTEDDIDGDVIYKQVYNED